VHGAGRDRRAEFAIVEAPRPSELDALRWERIRWDDDAVDINEQWNAKTRTFTEPGYDTDTIALVGRGRDVLHRMKRDDSESPFVFTTLRGSRYTPTSRIHHWNRARCSGSRVDEPLSRDAALLGLVRAQRPGA
jgi:hypothetical protein